MAALGIICGYCGTGVFAEVVYSTGNRNPPAIAMQCPKCLELSVHSPSGVRYPVAPAFDMTVKNLPGDVENAWREAVAAHAVGANTASEIMCRKILMHLAVDVANAKAGDTFGAYIDALDTAGYITTGLKDVVDAIRQRGNTANHDLPASTSDEALATLTVTKHLLTSVYAFGAPASG